MGIACSWSRCIDGFPRSSRPSRSSVPRLSYVGIEPASVGTGGGNPALLEADRRLLPVSVVGCYFWEDRPLALFAHDQTKQFDIFITLTYIPEVLTAPVLVAFVVLGLRALNNQPLSRLQTTAVLTVDVIEDSAAQRSRFSRNGFSGAENSSAFLAFATASAANFLDSKLKRVT